MDKEQSVVEFYVLCNKLKYIIRTGWLEWNIKSDRLESVAEHIYGTQMLAIAMWSEYHYDIDIKKVLLMLSVHEMEEVMIGDLTMFDVDKNTKKQMGHDAVAKVLGKLASKEYIQNIIFEFDECKTPEAIFANQCDKFECDLQCKLYDENGCVDLQSQQGNKVINVDAVEKMLKSSNSLSEAWLKFGQQKYNYDANFRAVSNHCLQNSILLNTSSDKVEK